MFNEGSFGNDSIVEDGSTVNDRLFQSMDTVSHDYQLGVTPVGPTPVEGLYFGNSISSSKEPDNVVIAQMNSSLTAAQLKGARVRLVRAGHSILSVNSPTSSIATVVLNKTINCDEGLLVHMQSDNTTLNTSGCCQHKDQCRRRTIYCIKGTHVTYDIQRLEKL